MSNRGVLDLLAAFGSDVCVDRKTSQIVATPFCFITGSGHQYFLDTVRQLWASVNQEQIESALFKPWSHQDEKLSMRWDPIEDRRYALMWEDPTSSGNEARTNWAANLLAYHGLQLIPSCPTGKGLQTTGFVVRESHSHWTWPIWEQAISEDVVRSLLACDLLNVEVPDSRLMTMLGVKRVFRSKRITIGKPPLHKINFTPATAVF
jgi:hypothetical protein